jgi:glycosyltransferase involved in cell wall biosynthesis
MSSRPLVSVVIPAYNHERYVAQAIRSVLEQDYPALELVIIDDGSRDGTARVIKETLASAPRAREMRVVFRRQRNSGAHVALNRGLALARGAYLTILNSDDYYLPGRLSRLVEQARRGHELLFTLLEVVDEGGKRLDAANAIAAWYFESLAVRHLMPSLGFALLRDNLAVTTGNFFFSRDLYRRVGGFRDFRYAHDLDFLYRAMLHAEPRLVQERLLAYRAHAGNTIALARGDAEVEGRAIVQQHFDRTLLLERARNRLAPGPRLWPGYYPRYFWHQRTFFAEAQSVAHWVTVASSAIVKAARGRRIPESVGRVLRDLVEDDLSRLPALLHARAGLAESRLRYLPAEPAPRGLRFRAMGPLVLSGADRRPWILVHTVTVTAEADMGRADALVLARVRGGRIVATGGVVDASRRRIRFAMADPAIAGADAASALAPGESFTLLRDLGWGEYRRLDAAPGRAGRRPARRSPAVRILPHALGKQARVLRWRGRDFRLRAPGGFAHVDALAHSGGALSVSGWALDGTEAADALVWLKDGEEVRGPVRWHTRPDVAHGRGRIVGAGRAGFSSSVAASEPELGRFSLVALHDRGVATLLVENGEWRDVRWGLLGPGLEFARRGGRWVLAQGAERRAWRIVRGRGSLDRPAELAGCIDPGNAAAPSTLRGWGFDHARKEAPVGFLAARGRRALAACVPMFERGDIQHLHRLRAPLVCGFELTLPRRPRDVEVFALMADGTAVPLLDLR